MKTRLLCRSGLASQRTACISLPGWSRTVHGARRHRQSGDDDCSDSSRKRWSTRPLLCEGAESKRKHRAPATHCSTRARRNTISHAQRRRRRRRQRSCEWRTRSTQCDRTPACRDHWMLLRVLHYNPLSANQLRLEDILRATRIFSIVGWVATQRRAPVRLEIGSSKQFGCTIVEAGWVRAPLSNKSAGILIAVRKPFTSEHIHQTWTPPHHHYKVEHSRHVSKEGFFRSVCLLHVPSSQTTSCIKKRRIPEDCGTSVGLAGWLFE